MKNKQYLTIQDIADLAGVSKSTVSRYLNGGSVGKKTRQKLEIIIDEYDYQPNMFAQSLKAKQSNIIGVVVPRLTSYSVHESLKGIDLYCEEKGYTTLIVNTYQDSQREIQALKTFGQQNVAGIIFYGRVITEEHLDVIERIAIPVVVLGQEARDIPYVIYNDYEAGRQIGQYVSRMGHQNVLYFGVTAEDKAVGVSRRQGVIDGLQSGTKVEEVKTGFSIENAYQTGMRALLSTQATYAICATDNIALGVLKAARQLGIEVPTDLSISGFGGYAMGEAVHPSLTTIHYDFQKAGDLAAHQLLEVINKESISSPVVVDCHLEVRESTIKH